MKYKRILIFLIVCLLIVSSALIAYVYLSKDNEKESNNNEIKVHQNSNTDIEENNTVIQNTSDVKSTIVEENIVENIDVQEHNEDKSKNEIQEKSHIEEQTSEDEENMQDGEQIALNLVKDEWGEDDSVYYTIDRHVGNKYDISVRSKANTQSLMEYEIDINKKTIEMK